MLGGDAVTQDPSCWSPRRPELGMSGRAACTGASGSLSPLPAPGLPTSHGRDVRSERHRHTRQFVGLDA